MLMILLFRKKNLLTPFRASCIASPAIGMAFLVYYLIPVRPPPIAIIITR